MRALRPVAESDSGRLLRWRNSPDVSRFMYTDHPISAQEHADWLQRSLRRADARYFVITRDGEPVGFASITAIDRAQLTAEWAIYLGEPTSRGHGMGAFTTYTVLDVAFGELGLRKLSCEALAFNTPAIDLYERFGFVREGRLRAQILKPEGPVDVIRLGILADEWAERRSAERQRLIGAGILTD